MEFVHVLKVITMNCNKINESVKSSRGERLNVARIMANMTQEELAEKAGFSDRSYISRMETGKTYITYENISRFAEVLNVPAEWLRCETDILENPTPKEFPTTSTDEKTLACVRTLIDFLSCRGFNIKFEVVIMFESKRKHGAERVQVPFSELDNVNLAYATCIIRRADEVHECMIESVIINDEYMEYYYFIRELSRLERLIDFTANEIINNSGTYQHTLICEQNKDAIISRNAEAEYEYATDELLMNAPAAGFIESMQKKTTDEL